MAESVHTEYELLVVVGGSVIVGGGRVEGGGAGVGKRPWHFLVTFPTSTPKSLE